MNAACLRCNLRTLNQHKHLSQGPYAQQFEIDVNPANRAFVKNPYVPGKCDVSNLVCFSLTGGAQSCHHETSLSIGYNVEGKMVKTSVRHMGK